MFKPGNVGDIMDAVGINNENLIKRSALVQDIFAQQDKDAADMVSNMGVAGNSSQIVLKAQQLADLDAQNKGQQLATNLGINPGVSSDVLDKISEEWKASKLDAIDKRQKLAHDLDIKFLDHPVDYVKAQMGLESTVRNAEIAAARSNAATKDFADLQTLTQNIPGQMAALKQTKTAATVQATLEGAAAEIATKMDAQKIANAGINVNRINALNTMDSQQLQNLGVAMQTKNSAESLALSQQHMALAEKQFVETQKANKLAAEDRLERLNEKKEDRVQMKDAADTVRLGAATMGFKDISAWPDAKIITMLNSKRADIVDFYHTGINTQSAGKPMVSEDPGQVGRMIVQHNAPMTAAQGTVKTFLRDNFLEAGSTQAATVGGYDRTKPELVAGAARTSAIAKAKAQQGNIDIGNANNIYAPPPLESVLSVNGVNKTAWYTSVMAPQMVTGALKETNPDQLISLTAAAIKAGKVSHAEGIKGLTLAFTAAAAVNNSTKNYDSVGLPMQTSFNTKLPDAMGVPRNYNLLTPQDVTRAVALKLRGVTMQEATAGATGFGTFN
jgi:hypothetical protein